MLFGKSTETGDEFTSPRAYDLLSNTMSLGRRDAVFARAAAELTVDTDASIADIGCGTGALTLALARRFPDARVQGIDPSLAMVAAARSANDSANLAATFDLATAQALPYADGGLDAITYSLSLHHIPAADRPEALREARRVLRPGGQVLVVEMDPQGVIGRTLSMHGTNIRAELDVAGALDRAGFIAVRAGRVTRRLLGWWAAERPISTD